MNESLLLYALLVPGAAGLLCWVLGRTARTVAVLVALIGAALTLWVTGRAFAPFLSDSGSFCAFSWPWLELNGLSLGLVLKAGMLNAFIAFAVAAFTFLMTLYSAGYMRKEAPHARYYAYIMWALGGSVMALYADHLLVLLIGWEIVTLMLFLLVNMGGTEKAAKGAMKSFVLLGLSDCAMLAAIALLWATGQTPNFLLSEIPAGGLSVGSGMTYLTYILLLAGALAKAGAMPFHTWLPAAAEGAPTSVMAFLPASLDKLLGIYLLALISLRMFALDDAMKLLLLIVGSVTVLGAVMMAMIQHDLKKLLSFHAVSQVGYMVLGIGTGVWIGVLGGLFHMLNNAIYKSTLFLAAGNVERKAGGTNLDRLGGLGRVMPVTFVTCGIAALAISGVPPLNGFASKWMIYRGLLASPLKLAPLALVAAVFGSALTLASFVKVLHAVFAGPMSPSVAAREPREVGSSMLIPMVILAALCVLFGLWYTLPTETILGPAMKSLGVTAPEVSVGGLWQPLPALGLVVLGLIGGLIIYGIGKGLRVRRTRMFVGGELVPSEPYRVSGTGFYNTVRRLPLLRGMYRDAEGEAYDIYRLGGRFGGSLVKVLRGFHSGVLPLYVSWCLLGLMILIAFLVKGS